MPAGLIPDDEKFFVRISLSKFGDDFGSDVHILPFGFEGMFRTGLDIQESIDTAGIPGTGNLDFRELSFRQPDFLRGGLIGQMHFVFGENDNIRIIPHCRNPFCGFGTPFLDFRLIALFRHFSGFVIRKPCFFDNTFATYEKLKEG